MVVRRSIHLLALLFLNLLGVASAIPATTQQWRFSVLLNDRLIGEQSFKLIEDGDVRELSIDANLNVKILFISVYRYVHKVNESWRGDCLRSIDSQTNDNGTDEFVRGAQTQAGFVVENVKGSRELLQSCVMTFAYWNPRLLEATGVLNAQTGEYIPIRVTQLARKNLSIRGEPRPADRYLITGDKVKIEVWYSPDREWLGLESITEKGDRLRYQLQ